MRSLRWSRWLAAAAGAEGIWGIRHAASPAVATWYPGTGARLRAGPLALRSLGDGDRVVVLLHGMCGSGDYFGGGFDALAAHSRLLVPDLLGFGDSMTLADRGFGLTDHLDALDAMLAELGLDRSPLTVAGHSMGAVLALHWAARRTEQVRMVVAFSAPLYTNPVEARSRIRQMGTLESIMGGTGPVPRLSCALMCRYRRTAGLLAVAVKPRLPIHIARAGVRHTWPAYSTALTDMLLTGRWEPALATLAAAGIPTVLAAGDNDTVPALGRDRQLAHQHPNVRVRRRPGAGHDLPLTDPHWCTAILAGTQ